MLSPVPLSSPPPALHGAPRRVRCLTPGSEPDRVRTLARRLVRSGFTSRLPDLLTFGDVLMVARGEEYLLGDAHCALQEDGGHLRMLFIHETPLQPLDLRRLAVKAHRARPGLLGALLRAARDVSRCTLPLITPQDARDGLHEQIHDMHEDFLELTGTRQEIVAQLHAQGLHAPEDARVLYDRRAMLPEQADVAALLDPAGLPPGLASTCARLRDLHRAARLLLKVLDDAMSYESEVLTFARCPVTRRGHDHLRDLADELSGLDSDGTVYCARVPLTPAGGLQYRRVLAAFAGLTELSAEAFRLLEQG